MVRISVTDFSHYINGSAPIDVKSGITLCYYLEVSLEDANLPMLTPPRERDRAERPLVRLVESMSEEEKAALDEEMIYRLFAQLDPDQIEAAITILVETMEPAERVRIAQIALAGMPLVEPTA
jgi:hypothetical protein